MTLRQFGGDQYVLRFSDLFVITCDYGLQDIDTVIIDPVFGFQKERRSTILLVLGMVMSGPLRSLKSGGPIGTHASLLIYRFQILLIPAFQLIY